MNNVLIEEAQRAQHQAARAGHSEESALQLRRLFLLKGSYRTEEDRCKRCGAREEEHPAKTWQGRERVVCQELTGSQELVTLTAIVERHQGALVCQFCAFPHSMFLAEPLFNVRMGQRSATDPQPCPSCPTCWSEEALAFMDPTSAHAILSYHEALSEANRKTFVGMGLASMARVALSLS